MENEKNGLVRVLGLKESISMTIGTVVGVGLFTCGSSQIGLVGSWIIAFTFVSLLISIWPCLIYGEMSAALPCAGGTYNFAKRGLNRLWANLSGWHYIVSVVAIGAGETLAFANYFKILMEQLGLYIAWLDSRIIALILVAVFLILNFRGIEQSGKAQLAFMFFFWGCSIAWFLYMIPNIHVEYFGGIKMDKLPSFKEMMYIFGLVWWCYTGFETCVSMGAETKYPQYNLPRALKLSIFLVFALNALFQWFLVGLVPNEFYGILAAADAPYAEGLKAAGLIGMPIILLCIGIAFGGDLSTINPGIAAPARYIYTMAQDGALPAFLGKIHPKYKTPHIAIIVVGIINFLLIATGSIDYIASVSLISLAVCYMIGCLSYLGLKKKCPDMNRPYKAPLGKLGCWVTIVLYCFMLIFCDRMALITAAIITGLCIIFYFLFTRKRAGEIMSIEDEIGVIEEPTAEDKKKLDKEYKIWKYGTIIVTIIALGIYIIPMIIK
ncbi:MAG: APC family permease [Treponema sp.]|nr:APC family permease [Treponema sp.]